MISGKIEPLSVFKILRTIMSRKMSGTLRFLHGEHRKAFGFFHGELRFSFSTLSVEHTLNRLRDLGLLSSVEMQELKRQEICQSEQCADEIMKAGLVAEHRLSRIESGLARERLLQLFEWEQGTYSFEEELYPSEVPSFELDLTAVLVEGAFARTPIAVCEQFLNSLESSQVLRVVGSPSESVLDAVGATKAFQMVERGVPLQELLSDFSELHTHIRVACALILSGAGILTAGAKAAVEQAGSRSPVQTERSEGVTKGVVQGAVLRTRSYDSRNSESKSEPNADAGRRVVFRAGEQPSNTSKASQSDSSVADKPSTPNAGRGERKAPRQRQDILAEVERANLEGLSNIPERERLRLMAARDLVSGSQNKNHYEILGVSRGASSDSVRERFRGLAREFHADRFSRYDLPECVHQLIQLTFVTINASNEVLGDPERRAEYDLELSLKSSGKLKGKPNSSAPNELNRALLAERELTATLSCLRRGEGDAARERLKKGVTLGLDGPLIPVLKTYINYLYELSRGGRGLSAIQAKALEEIGSFAKESEGYPELFLFMGRIYKHKSDPKKAMAAFKKAVALSPNLAEASSELRYLQRQLESESKGLRGLLKS